jgi:hypothetical protein
MKRGICIILAFLMLPLSGIIPSISADTSNLIEAGVTDNFDEELIFWQRMDDGTILTVDTKGNLSVNSFSNGMHSSQWSIDLNVSANSARLDDAQQLVAVAHDDGVSIILLNFQIVTRNISIGRPVDSVDWDNAGDLWLAHYAGRRRAEEYSPEGETGVVTDTISTGLSAFMVLGDGRIITGSYDTKVYVSDDGGGALYSLTDSNAIIKVLFEDSNGDLIVGNANGKLFRYDTNTWNVETLTLPHGKAISSIQQYDNSTYAIGSKSGHLSIVDVSTFSEQNTLVATGYSVGSFQDSTTAIYLATTTPTSSKIYLFDVDTDGDGVTDRLDAFPAEPTQWDDADGDGYGDNPLGFSPDVFPQDITQHSDSDGDGYGDSPTGVDGDLFPNNADQWQDRDGDGYGDNVAGQDGDKYPDEPTQWVDSDMDGYGDNPAGVNPDSCPQQNGFSTIDRFGCLDSDQDGYSNPTSDWGIADGADALPNQGSQWLDGDGDGYGDNTEGLQPDACPWQSGTSVKSWLLNESSALGFSEVIAYGCEDLDGDGWVDSSESTGMETDPNEHHDGDGDGVGANSDYDDDNPSIKTEKDHCLKNNDDVRDQCLGWRSEGYQDYLSRDREVNETDMSFYTWNASMNAGSLTDGGNIDEGILAQVATVGGIAFISLTIVILVAAMIVKKRRVAGLVKMYGVPYVPKESSASLEALQGSAGSSAIGGVESDAAWEDNVESLDFSAEHNAEKDSVGLQNEIDGAEQIDAEEIYDDSSSIEDIAGMPQTQAPVEEATPAPAPNQPPAEAAPLPEGGLPAGWTMEQWRWYGHEWLAKNAK